MKKALTIILLFSVFAVSLFADSFRFSIVWENTVASESLLSVVNTTDDNSISTKPLSLTVDEQPVARIKYTTNEGGTHKLIYKATPLKTDSDDTGYAFILKFYYPDSSAQPATINVGKNKNLTYPNGSLENSAYTDLPMGNSGSMNTEYVSMTVQMYELAIMPIDKQYTSTITIVRQSV